MHGAELCLACYQFFPKLSAAAGMRYHYSAANDIGHGKYLVYFVSTQPLLVAFDEVILDAVVAAQYHAGHKAQHLLGLYTQRPFGIRIGIQVKEPVDHLILLAEYHLVHLAPVFVEFL